MLFLFPMWDNESQRIGMQKCTPLGYKLHAIADVLGFVGLILLLGTVAYLAAVGLRGTFHLDLLWLFAVPFGVGMIAETLHGCSWKLADRKGFRYDYEKGEASWMENGERVVFKWSPEEESR